MSYAMAEQFGEDKNLLTVPGIEKRLLSRAHLATVSTQKKCYFKKLCHF
jgi:hypothetical protein